MTTTRAKILVIDDDPKLSRLVKAILEKTKLYEVREENRPSQALSAVREFRPDMILLDVDMPGKGGGDVAREIEADSILHCPIVFFTSLVAVTEAGEHEIVRAGRRFLAKPVNPMVLLDVIGRVLNEPAVPAR